MQRYLCLAVFGALLVGCYTLQPTSGVTELGSVMAFAINDRGRVALGGSVGPEIDQIEGRVLQATADEYLVAVSAVRFLRGGHQIWAGEQVRISSEHVGYVLERRFSRGRTLALGAAAVGGVTAFLLSRELGVLGGGDGTTPCCDSIPLIRVRP